MDNDELSAKLFKALAHPARLAILDTLRQEEECVCHLATVLGLRQAYISQQLMVLRDVGLVEDRREGWNIFYRVTRPQIYAVIDAMRQVIGIENTPTKMLTHFFSSGCPCPKCRPADKPMGLEQPFFLDVNL